jgi:hypothetical protein
MWAWFIPISLGISVLVFLYLEYPGQTELQVAGLSRDITPYLRLIPIVSIILSVWKLVKTPILYFGDIDPQAAHYQEENRPFTQNVYFLTVKKKGFGSADGCEGLISVGKQLKHYTVWDNDEARISITIDGRLRLFEISENGEIIFRTTSRNKASDIVERYYVKTKFL